MRATVMYGAHDVRVETVPDARVIEATDALVRVTRACICGSDLWPYNSMAPTNVPSACGTRTASPWPSQRAYRRTVGRIWPSLL
jgi:threonine dehydrogenase-like Zn-dependent dehydrogenase